MHDRIGQRRAGTDEPVHAVVSASPRRASAVRLRVRFRRVGQMRRPMRVQSPVSTTFLGAIACLGMLLQQFFVPLHLAWNDHVYPDVHGPHVHSHAVDPHGHGLQGVDGEHGEHGHGVSPSGAPNSRHRAHAGRGPPSADHRTADPLDVGARRRAPVGSRVPRGARPGSVAGQRERRRTAAAAPAQCVLAAGATPRRLNAVRRVATRLPLDRDRPGIVQDRRRRPRSVDEHASTIETHCSAAAIALEAPWSARPRRVRRRIGALTLVFTALVSCQSYEPRPLDREAHRQAWHARTLEASSLRAFLERLDLEDAAPTAAFDATDGLSLREGELVARVFNPRLRLARMRAGRALADVEHGGRWRDPRFSLSLLRITESVPDRWVIAPTLGFSIPLSGRLAAERGLRGGNARERPRSPCAKRIGRCNTKFARRGSTGRRRGCAWRRPSASRAPWGGSRARRRSWRRAASCSRWRPRSSPSSKPSAKTSSGGCAETWRQPSSACARSWGWLRRLRSSSCPRSRRPRCRARRVRPRSRRAIPCWRACAGSTRCPNKRCGARSKNNGPT